MRGSRDNLDIVLINPWPKAEGINEATIEPPLGLAYIAAVLEREGFKPDIVDASVLRLKVGKVAEIVLQKKPKIVGISANVISARSAFEISRILKRKNKNLKVIFGGPHPTALPKETLEKSKADAIVLGEGEETALEICQRMKRKRPLFKNVAGLVYRENGEIIQNERRPLIGDLDSLPFPAYHLLPDLNCYKTRARKKPVASIFTSRGCPFQCVYCSSNIFGKKYRMRSPQNVLEEIDYLVKHYQVKQIDILDDNFTLIKERTDKIFDGLIARGHNLAINLQSGIRADRVDKELIKKMRKAGVFKIAFGVETGDKRVLKIIKKSLDLRAVLKATKWAKKEGITTYGFFMFGLPGETKTSMQKTINFAKKMDPDIAHFGITVPFPGTELYEEIKRRGKFLISVEDGLSSGFEAGEVFYTLDKLNPQLVQYFYKKAYREFYFRPAKIIQMVFSIKSIPELKWILEAGFLLLGSLVKKSAK